MLKDKEAAKMLEAQRNQQPESRACERCGWTAVHTTWIVPASFERDEAPQWAKPFLDEGITEVHRYSCPECKAIVAVVGVGS